MLVVVAGRPAFRREAHRADAAAGVDELGGENRSVAGELVIVAVLLLDGELEAIARLHLGAEVDLAAEDVGERQREIDGLAGRVERGDERRVLAVDLRR